jgi:diguanylate cyclase (GGDEF)-like protein/PAS domain S-box-containing protein
VPVVAHLKNFAGTAEWLSVQGTGVTAAQRSAATKHPAPESDFDDLARAAARAAGVAGAVIALPRGKSQWFRGSFGVAARTAPWEGSLAELVTTGRDELDIHEAAEHPQLTGDLLFREPDAFCSAIGFPLRRGTGESLGALILLDNAPLQLSAEQRSVVRTLGRQAVAQLELRRLNATAEATLRRLGALESRYQKLAVNRFAEAQAMTKLGTWEWDSESGQMTWSAEVFRTFGITSKGKSGIGHTTRHGLDLIHPADRDGCRSFVRRVLKTGERTGYLLRTLTAAGLECYIEGWAEAELDPVSGRSVRVWGTVQDVTERVSRELALAESEQRLRVTIDNSPIGFALVGLDGRWLQVNEAMARMVGRESADLMKLTFQDITHPDDLAADLKRLAELNAGTRLSYQMDKRYLHADGHIVWVSLTASVVRRGDGTPLHYVSQVEDITERRQAAAELHAERDLSAALLGALHDGYAYYEQGRIIVVNDVFCEMTGLRREELIGTSAPFEFLSGDAVQNTQMFWELINDKSGNGELVMQRPDGSRLDVGIQVRPVRHSDGRLRGYVALIRDITDRKLDEKRLRHRADHDGLTGLLNRAAFHVRLAERVAAAHASGAPLTLAVIDLDRFKAVNDEHGHPAGDAVLAEFADRLRGNARGDDAIGRLGGEEFGWIMSETGREEAVGALGRTLDAVRRHPFPHGGQLTFSAGVAQLRTYAAGPDEREALIGETAPALVQRTDRLLYVAKAGGRDRVVAAPELEPLSPGVQR